MDFDPYTTEIIITLTIAEIGAIVARCVGDYDALKQRDRFAMRAALHRMTKAALNKVQRMGA